MYVKCQFIQFTYVITNWLLLVRFFLFLFEVYHNNNFFAIFDTLPVKLLHLTGNINRGVIAYFQPISDLNVSQNCTLTTSVKNKNSRARYTNMKISNQLSCKKV